MSTQPDDDFDNDALQEGLGRTLAGITALPGVQPGLAQALFGGDTKAAPSQGCVDIYGYTGVDGNPFGHVGFSKDGGPVYGKTPIPGYKGRSLMETVPGYLEQVSPNRKPDDHVRICAAPQRIETAYRYWSDPRNSQAYSATGNNCSTLIPDGLRWAGLPFPGGDMMLPTDLMKALHPMYDSSGQMQFQGPRP